MFQMTISSNDDVVLPFEDDEMNQGYSLLQNSYQLRSGQQRIPTPDKDVLLNLSSSFRKHHLKKHQQLLDDITRRCREQEVRDMSDAITTKCTLSKFAEKPPHAKAYKELTFYHNHNRTTLIGLSSEPRNVINGGFGSSSIKSLRGVPNREVSIEPPKLLFEPSNTHFPPRQVKKTPRRYASPFRSFPPLQIRYQKGVHPTDGKTRQHLVKHVKINGTVQMEIYNHQKNDQLSPLVLPRINDKGMLEEYFKSQKVNLELGPRSRSILIGSVRSNDARIRHSNTRHCLKDTMSTGQLTVRSGSTETEGTDFPHTAPAETTDIQDEAHMEENT